MYHPQLGRNNNITNNNPAVVANIPPSHASSLPVTFDNRCPYEITNINGDDFIKVKSELILDFDIKGMGSKAWDFLRMICAMSVFELFHNINVPETYLITITSHLYKTSLHAPVTYIENGPRSLLWGRVTIHWVTGSALTPLSHKLMSSHFYHAFPLMATSSEICRIYYQVTYVQKPYWENQINLLLETGYQYIETLCKKLKCKDEIMFMLKIRSQMPIFAYNSVLKLMESTPVITSKSGTAKLGDWDLSNFNKKSSTPIQKFFRGITQSSSSKGLEKSIPSGCQDTILALPWK